MLLEQLEVAVVQVGYWDARMPLGAGWKVAVVWEVLSCMWAGLNQLQMIWAFLVWACL